jgi:ribosome-associated protein
MIQITPTLAIDEREITEDFVRASGPGGQNVNKVSTAVELRFDVQNSPSLPDDIRHRLLHLVRNRLTAEGVLIVTARQFRTQIQNRRAAQTMLIDLIRQAVEPPRPHLKTRPTLASKRRRLESKRRHSETKQRRRTIPRDD